MFQHYSKPRNINFIYKQRLKFTQVWLISISKFYHIYQKKTHFTKDLQVKKIMQLANILNADLIDKRMKLYKIFELLIMSK